MLPPSDDLDSLGKAALFHLCDLLLTDDLEVIEWCVKFFESESWTIWHGRARAKMARRFKHCALSISHHERIVTTVLNRLAAGEFSEQFKDQLRLVLHFAPRRAILAAGQCAHSEKEHVQRYAAWLLPRARERLANFHEECE